MTQNIAIRRLTEADLERADQIVREAFSSHLQISPADFAAGHDLAEHFWVEPEGAFGAFDNDELAGVMFATIWGSFGFFGPLCVSSAHWNKGIAQLLLSETDKYFELKQVRTTGLYTFADSAKHIRLYERFGYHTQMLTANLAKKLPESRLNAIDNILVPAENANNCFPLVIEESPPPRGELVLKLLSKMDAKDRSNAVADMDQLTNETFPGLSLATEAINSVPSTNGNQKFIAETLLVYADGTLKAFAICPLPPSNAAEKSVYAKFGIAKSHGGTDDFDLLLRGLERYAQLIGASKIRASTNTARRICYQRMLLHGYQAEGYGIALIRPDTVAYNRPDVFVLDDWR